MPLIVACPACGRKLQLPEGSAGETVRCPACQAMFTAPGSAKSDDEILEAEVVAFSPERRRDAPPVAALGPGLGGPNILRETRSPWEKFNLGLGLIFAGVCIDLLLYLCTLIVRGSFHLTVSVVIYGDVRSAMCCVSLLSLASGGLTIAGLFVASVSAPEGVRRWFGFAAIALMLILLLPGRMMATFDDLGFQLLPYDLHIFLGRPGWYLAFGFSLLLVREVGRVLKDRQTLACFRGVLLLYIVVAVVTPPWMFFSMFVSHGAAGASQEAMLFFGAMAELPYLALMVQELRLLTAARRAVRKHLATLVATKFDPDDER